MKFSLRALRGQKLGFASICLALASTSSAQVLTGPETVQADLNGVFRYTVGLSAPEGDAVFGMSIYSNNTTEGMFVDWFCDFGLISSFEIPSDGGYARLIDPSQEGTVNIDVTLCESGSARLTTRILPDPRAIFMRTGRRPISIAAADFDGDTHLDVVTANRSSDDVTVLLGGADGIFQSNTSYPVGIAPSSVAVADFNGDSLPDIATANANSSDVSVLLNTGSGDFGPATSWEANRSAFAVAAADFDGDTVADVVVAGFSGVSVLLGNGDGSFEPGRSYTAGDRPKAVAVGDLDRDGAMDVVTANGSSGYASVLLGRGDGTLGAPSLYPTWGYDPVSVALADLDGDGILDFAFSNALSDDVTVRFGSGDGTFRLTIPSAAFFEVGVEPRSVAVANIDSNSIPDIVTANARSDSVSVIANPFDWTIPARIDIKPGSDANRINRSARGRLPVALFGSEELDVAQVDPSTLAFGSGQAPATHDLSDPGTLADHIRDVNGDGFPDLVTHYPIQEASFSIGDTEACLNGKLLDGRSFEGCDSVSVSEARGARRSPR